MAYVIGIDVGTSGTKGLLVAESGRIAAAASVEYGMTTPQPGWAEQEPEDWWRAAATVIRKLKAPYYRAVCPVSVIAPINQLVVSFVDMQLTWYRTMVYLGFLIALPGSAPPSRSVCRTN